jgi:cell division protein FtsQ
MTATIDPRIQERRIEVQREAGRRRLRITLLVMLVFVVVGLAYLVVHSPLLDVDHVRVTGADHGDPNQVISVAEVETGEPLLRVDTGAVQARVEEIPWIERAEVDKRYPGTLQITVHERVPVAYVRRDDATVTVLDANGFAITDLPSPPAGLFEVRDAEKVPPVGGTLEPANAAGVVRALPPALATRVVAIDLGGDGVALVLDTGGEVRLCAPVDLEAKGAAAVAVLERLGATPFAYVDVCVPQSPIAGGTGG